MCIFHLPNKKPVEAEEFNSRLLAEIKRMEEDANLDMIDLSGFRFPEPSCKFPSGTRFEKAISFREALFEGKVDFSRAEFSGPANFCDAKFIEGAIFLRTIFSGDTTFDHTELGDTSFIESVFLSGASFREVKFGYASFNDAKFLLGADFTYTEFSQITDFSSAKFSGDTAFSHARFLGFTLFIYSEFSGSVTFERAKFSAFVTFEKAKFSGWSTSFFESEFSGDVNFFESEFLSHAVFNRSKVACLVTFKATIFQTKDTQILFSPINQYTHFEEIKVESPGEVRFEGGVCMSRISLHYADIRRFSFLDVKWGRLRSRASIMEHGILEERKRRSKNEKSILPDLTPEHVQQIYVRLRRNLERGAGRYPEAGDFFINEKEVRTLILQEGRRWPPAENLPEWLILKVYGSLALYGESIMRPVFWTAVTIFGFAALKIVAFRLQTAGAKPFLDFLMESLMAFFQMRSEPGLDIIERLVSVPILGSLFIALKRKFERR